MGRAMRSKILEFTRATEKKSRMTEEEREVRFGEMVDRLGPGQVIGALSLVRRERRFVTAIAT